MRINKESWIELREFTRDFLDFETPDGELDRQFFERLRDELVCRPQSFKDEFNGMTAEWSRHDRERFMRLFRLYCD